MFAHAFSHDAYAHLAEVRCPVTLACGADTDGFGPDVLGAFAQRLDAVADRRRSPAWATSDRSRTPPAVAASVHRALVPVD